MNIRLRYAIRFLTLSLTFLSTEYSYSGEYSYAAEQAYFTQLMITQCKKEHKEIMSHYDQMIKKAELSPDADKLEMLRAEALSIEDVYENYMAVYSLYSELHAKYSSHISYYEIFCVRRIEKNMKEISEFEKYISEINKLANHELLTYARRTGLVRNFQFNRPEILSEYSHDILNEYDAYSDSLDANVSLSDVARDRFIYLEEEEMPKLILSLRDSLKHEILERQLDNKELTEKKQKIEADIYPYFEFAEVYYKLSTNYSKLKNKYILLHKISDLVFDPSFVRKKSCSMNFRT